MVYVWQRNVLDLVLAFIPVVTEFRIGDWPEVFFFFELVTRSTYLLRFGFNGIENKTEIPLARLLFIFNQAIMLNGWYILIILLYTIKQSNKILILQCEQVILKTKKALVNMSEYWPNLPTASAIGFAKLNQILRTGMTLWASFVVQQLGNSFILKKITSYETFLFIFTSFIESRSQQKLLKPWNSWMLMYKGADLNGFFSWQFEQNVYLIEHNISFKEYNNIVCPTSTEN